MLLSRVSAHKHWRPNYGGSGDRDIKNEIEYPRFCVERISDLASQNGLLLL